MPLIKPLKFENENEISFSMSKQQFSTSKQLRKICVSSFLAAITHSLILNRYSAVFSGSLFRTPDSTIIVTLTVYETKPGF